MTDLATEIRKAFNGNPWHGQNVLYLLTAVTPEKVFSRPVANAHTIAEIVAHLTAWTEEIMDRLMGKAAKTPERGDWPGIVRKDHIGWNTMLDELVLANDRLIALCAGMGEEKFREMVTDNRPHADLITKEELISGLLQHHAYHAGQISLLLKF